MEGERFQRAHRAHPFHSRQFCASCNRLRLTASGFLKLCLFSNRGISLKALLRGGVSDGEFVRVIEQAIRNKPENHLGRIIGTVPTTEGKAVDRACGMYRLQNP
ncbi:hypothetical protein LJC49_03375 [Ruminococcaceae bacterium OttesenSCG-928-I18]|nr:hypothetical protein [Ruminococcaceae bacterium OttesenSCG-928-I18]